MPEYKNQHYVPQYYLKFFNDGNNKICVYNFDKMDEFMVPVSNVCSNTYFYGEGNIEESLNDFETQCSELIEKIIENGNLNNISNEEYTLLLQFILFQRRRTKKAKNEIDEIVQHFFREITKYGVESGELDEKAYDLAQKGKIRLEHPMFQYSLLYGPLFYRLIADLEPLLIQNETKKDFVIGEHPIIFDNPLFKHTQIHGGIGPLNKGLVIICPLSTEFAILLYDPKSYKFEFENRLKIKIKDPLVIKSLNICQYIYSDSNLFYGQCGRKYEMRTIQKYFREDKQEEMSKHIEYTQSNTKKSFLQSTSNPSDSTPYLPFLKEKNGVEFKLERIEGLSEEIHKEVLTYLEDFSELSEDEIKNLFFT